MDKVLICKVLFWFAFIVGFAYMILIIEAASRTWFRVQFFLRKRKVRLLRRIPELEN